MRILSTMLIVTIIFLSPVAVAQDKPMNGLEIKIAEILRSGVVTVEVRNACKVAIRIWRQSGSLGADRWRVLRIRNGQLETFFQNPNQRFTRNEVLPVEIAGGAHSEQKFDLNGGNWCGFGHCSSHNERGFGGREASFAPGDSVVVIYDVPRTNEARKMNVWYGVVAASTVVK
jgi:hypothetical protein